MSIKRSKPLFSLADQLFNETTVEKLSSRLRKAHPRFDATGFQAEALKKFPSLELKERIAALVDGLESRLPKDYEASLAILRKALPPALNPGLNDDDFGEFIWCVPAEYVARHGVKPERLGLSLMFLREATMRFSAENAIRPFLADYPDETLTFVKSCSTDNNYHVRRLASEGIRPLLPWARKVVLPTETILEVLDVLHADQTRYVTRSVANNLNDLSKSDPELVLQRMERWREDGAQQADELNWMTRHGLRTLLKQGSPNALEFLGYPSNPAFTLSRIRVSEKVLVGEKLRWQGTLRSKENQKLKVGLNVHFLKADGRHSEKLFAVTDIMIGAGDKLDIDKAIGFQPLSTRALYPGTHYIELVVNGISRGKKAFELTEK